MVILNSQVDFSGTINPNETATSTNQFEFTIDPDVFANQDIRLEVELSSTNLTQTDYIVLDLTAPLLIFDTYYLPGNGNMILDPGETSNLTVAIKNVGNEEINDISAVLSCESSYITISEINKIGCSMTYAPLKLCAENIIRPRASTTITTLSITVDSPKTSPIILILTFVVSTKSNKPSTIRRA